MVKISSEVRLGQRRNDLFTPETMNALPAEESKPLRTSKPALPRFGIEIRLRTLRLRVTTHAIRL